MHITIIAVGSHGDVQPCIALGLGLKRAGYQVRIAAYGVFSDFVESYDLEFASIAGNPREMMDQQPGQTWLQSGDNPLAFARGLKRLTTRDTIKKGQADTLEACRGTHAVIYSMFGAAGYHVAEMLGVPSMFALLQPFSRTREFPSITLPGWSLGGSGNWLTHLIGERLIWQMVRAPYNRWRREVLKLKPLSFRGPFDLLYQKRVPYLYGFSQYVVPRPRDWPDWHVTTGYWFLDSPAEWSPPPGLLDFLSQNPKPIYIGFGSMSGRIARRLATPVIEAVRLSNQRAVLLGGWASIHEGDLPDNIYAIESAPHDWLFPHMAAVVHHGGAGTTAAGLRAGVPSVVVPFFADQPYWGSRIHSLGVGPKPILQKKLTAQSLANAITQAVTDKDMQHSAALLGGKIRAEDGVARAVEIVDNYINS
jgi:UDP:flavonoid glycosyltransferase YjiC (YdhE family)